MRVFHGAERNRRIVGCMVVKAPGSEKASRDRNPFIDALVRIGHDALLDEVDENIRYDTGMDAEIAMAEECPAERYGKSADAELNGRAVRNYGRDISRHCKLHFRGISVRQEDLITIRGH